MTAVTPAVKSGDAGAAAPTPAPAPAGPKELTTGDWIGFMSMVVGMFMAILDIQIVASSLSEVQAGLGASNDEISWVQTSYLVAEVIMIPLSGWLARVVSTRWLFFASCLTFTLSSAACAFAWNLESMIAFRALQGFLGGAMIPTVFAASFIMFPPRQRAGVSVMIGLVATMAPTIGPTLGGYLTQSLSWHWLFLINIVPGIFVTTLVFTFVHIDKPRLELLKGFDIWGILLIALFLGSLQYVLEEGARDDWFQSEAIILFTALSAVAAGLFFLRELTAEHPVVELRAFRDRNFAVGCLYSFIIGVGLYGSVYVIPLFLGRVRGYDSLEIGITMMVAGLFQALSAPLAGMLSRKMDLRAMLAMGLALYGGGLWLNSGVTADWDYWDLFLPQAVRGISLMFCFVPINNLALGMLPPHQVQNASGLYNLMRNLGGAIGLAAINTAITRRHDVHLLYLQEHVSSAGTVATNMLANLSARLEPVMGAAADQAALKIIGNMVSRQALVLTFSDVLLMMAGVFGFALLLMPLVRKVDPFKSAGGGGH